jgi:hypothetical protein
VVSQCNSESGGCWGCSSQLERVDIGGCRRRLWRGGICAWLESFCVILVRRWHGSVVLLEVPTVLARGWCSTRWPIEVHCSLVCIETFRLATGSAHFDWLFLVRWLWLIEAIYEVGDEVFCLSASRLATNCGDYPYMVVVSPKLDNVDRQCKRRQRHNSYTTCSAL